MVAKHPPTTSIPRPHKSDHPLPINPTPPKDPPTQTTNSQVRQINSKYVHARTPGTRQRRDPIHLTRNYLSTRSHSRWLPQKALDNPVENLVPIVINKLKAGQPPVIYGTDYPTSDGTCIRDYVDVRDIARAHLAAADSSTTLPLAMNVGTGRGGSVREVIKLVCAAEGKSEVVADEKERRAGDPAFLCADVSLIKNALSFTSMYSLETSTKSLC